MLSAVRRRRSFYACCLILLLVASPNSSFATDIAETVTVTPATLRVVMDDNYPPYAFRDSSGVLNGYLVDIWKLWEGKTGVRVELVATD